MIDTTATELLPDLLGDSATQKLWWKNEESEQILNRGYLLKGETVEGAIDRVCTAADFTNLSSNLLFRK
jgi:ribonucleoside-diphosphate reductase alpha chain